MDIVGAMPYLWVAVIVIAAVLEAISASLISIWFIPAAIIAIILSFAGVGVWIQTLVFFVAAGCMLALSRVLFKKYLDKKSIPTNADALIGTDVIVTEDIDNLNGQGAVKANGIIWSARSAGNYIITAGNIATVDSIEGVKLICRIKKS